MLDDYPDIRCVYCAGTTFREEESPTDSAIVRDAIVCQSCHKGNDVIDDVPFFGGYDADDFMGLIEIVASQEMLPAPIDPSYVRYLNGLLEDYDAAGDRAAFVRDHADEIVRMPWFAEQRYHEWTQTRAMLADRDLAGKRVLNVGAGYGFDSVPLVDAGAHVTCIDYSPMIVAQGRKGLPQARWIGGFSHLLPFRDESFDVVCANAALHHMRSTPIALREMIRVLKPGGFLFTVGDPVRPDGTTDDHALAVFNRHEGVLAGINEGIIRTGDFIDTLMALMPAIEVSLIASVADLSGIDGASPVGPSGFADCWVPWSAGNLAAVREQHGGLCVAVTKLASTAIPATRQEPDVLAAGTLATWLADPAAAYSQLMAWAPERLINLPFPGQKPDWFNLLNGWLAPESPFTERRAYRRARWLLQGDGTTSITFEARAPLPTDLTVSLDGHAIGSRAIGPDWTDVTLSFPQPATATPFLIELRVQSGTAASFDEQCFEVRHRMLDVDRPTAAAHGDNVAKAFADIYASNKWGAGSGTGSLPSNNVKYIAFVSNFLNWNDIKSVIDFGCGDWQFSRYICWSGITYTGVDIVETVVRRNNEVFGSDNIRFIVNDDLEDHGPVDLILIKDVLQHLPTYVINETISSLRRKCRYLLVTNDIYPDQWTNVEIEAGACRSLRLREAPFALDATTIFRDSYISYGVYVEKESCLIRGDVA